MRKIGAVSLLVLVSVTWLSGCGRAVQLSALEDEQSGQASSPVEASVAENLYADLESHLRGAKTVKSTQSKIQFKTTGEELGLSQDQILTVLTVIQGALQQSGLGSSNDLAALIPVFVQAANLGVGALQLDGEGLRTQLLTAIANSVLNSVVNLSGGTGESSELLQTLMQTLVGGFSSAGVGNDQIAGTAKGLMQVLLGRLGEADLEVSDWQGVLQSLTSGMVLGFGRLGLPASMLTGILQQMGTGSRGGLETLLAGISGNQSGGSSLVATLLQALTGGVQSSLGQVSGSGTFISSLISSFVQGLNPTASSVNETSTASTTASTTSSSGSALSSLLGLAGRLAVLFLL